MSVEENKRIDDAAIASWNTMDIDRFVGLCADDIVWHDVANPEPYLGKEGLVSSCRLGRQRSRTSVRRRPTAWLRTTQWQPRSSSAGPTLDRCKWRQAPQKFQPRGTRVEGGKGTYFARIKGGKIVEFHSYPDVAGMMMQLGLMPGP